ncbi:MAG TPA: amidohydrolase [Patescibacteria group bacterium]|nr:amidohydrolase [Patescibacteria group bacterium]
MAKILIKDTEVLSSDGTIRTADIAIDGDSICQMGKISPDWSADQVIDGREKLAIPGFINAHTHASMSLFRGYADDMLLMDWLENKIWPAEAKLTGDDVYWGAMLAIAEMLRSGTTCFADMYFFMPEVAKAVKESGIRAALSRGMAGVAPTAQLALEESESFFQEWHNSCDGRITVMLGPHAPYTCPPDYLKKVCALAEKLGSEIHIHLSETAGEVNDCLKQYGKTPIALMNEIGLLDHGVLAAHCVHLSPEDIALMKQKKVRAVHNPGSNMKLASGVAPVPELIDAGVCVALGTDGPASNNNLDMLEEIRLAAMLNKIHRLDPLAVSPLQTLDMATAQGAVALGLQQKTGRLAVGFKADITLIDMNAAHWYPRHDRLSLLTYSAQAADVHTVLVNGQILLDGRRLTTLDEERILFEANRCGLRVTAKNQ